MNTLSDRRVLSYAQSAPFHAVIARRIVAQLIDAVVLVPLMIFLFLYGSLYPSSSKAYDAWAIGVYAAYILMDLSNRGTLGKRMLGLRILTPGGATPRLMPLFVRWNAKYFTPNIFLGLYGLDVVRQVYLRRPGRPDDIEIPYELEVILSLAFVAIVVCLADLLFFFITWGRSIHDRVSSTIVLRIRK